MRTLFLPGSCSANLQVGIFKSRRCPPEGGRYICQNKFARTIDNSDRRDGMKRLLIKMYEAY
jgi:hypothetical protein